MKDFIKYINAIIKEPVFKKPAKRTTTILMPELDCTEGIYRSLLPAYILNSLDDYRVIVAGISERTGVCINNREFYISAALIAESDHIIFPFVSFPLQPIIDDIRSMKADMNFSYYINANFYTMPDAYPHANEYKTAKMIEVIEANIKAVDQIIVTNEPLVNYITEKLAEKYPGVTFGTQPVIQPLFIRPELFKTNIAPVVTGKSKVKLLIVGDESHFSDINYIKGILKDAKGKFKDALEIHIIGFDGNRGKNNYLKDLSFIHHERVPYFKYFELISHIAPTAILIPAQKNTFNNTSKNYVKYLEFAHQNITVLAPNLTPYSKIIKTNENGFLCEKKEDYLMQIEFLFSTPNKFDAALNLAYATAVDYNISLDNNINILKTIYFPNYAKK
jgi:hypothetical protein